MFSLSDIVNATAGKAVNARPGIRIRGFSTDSRSVKKGEGFICIKGDNFDGHKFISQAIAKGAKLVICQDTGIRTQGKIPFIKVKDTIKALGDLARFNRERFDIPVIAVTGSNGKTTTKEMISRVLSGKFKVLKNEGTKNNHIGVPMTLLKLSGRYDIAVLEIGTNHFGEVANLAGICLPNIGVITNIGPSHLKYFRSLSGVLKEKYSLFNYLRKPSIGIINADDQYLKKKIFTKQKNKVIIGLGINGKNDFQASGIKSSQGRVLFYSGGHKFRLNTLGRHNVYNALSAIAVARIFGIGITECAARLSSFEFPEGRLKILKSKGLNFIDDSYNANPLSLGEAVAALENFETEGRKIFLMGDMLELGSKEGFFHVQAGRLAARVFDVFITVGELSRKAFMAAGACGFSPENLHHCGSPAEARELLFKKITPGKDDVILFKGSHSMKMREIIGK